jgi:dihydrolipoamide dehydrogenase
VSKFSVGIIGGGPGGYVAAIRLNQYGIDTVVFEKERLGGVCLNTGCIPTKSLVKVAELYSEIKNSKNFGINVENSSLDFPAIMQRKDDVVNRLVSGVEFIFKKRKIPTIKKEVTKVEKIQDGYKISVAEEEYFVKYLVIATGSESKELPGFEFDGENILSSTDILSLKELPEHITVIGGGVVGCEFASVLNEFGCRTEVVEFLPKLVFNEDEEVSKRLAMTMKKAKIKLHLKAGAQSWEKVAGKIKLNLTNGKEIITDKILLSVGRVPVCVVDSVEKENGFVSIDDEMRTNLKNVFAIGDVTGKLMLAHTASKQGLIVANIIQNELQGTKNDILKLNYDNIPKCTFTHPEIGSVGLTEAKAKEAGFEILVGKFPFSANGKALGMGNTAGFTKVIADLETKKILGVHIIGPNATELIAQATAFIGLEANIEKVNEIVFAHPTLSETVMEAVEDLEKLAIHIL